MAWLTPQGRCDGGAKMAECLGSDEPGDLQGHEDRPDHSSRTTMSEHNVYGANAAQPPAKIRTHHLQKMKAEGHKWAMLTAYDYSTARIFDEAGIPVLLVG